MTILDDAGQLIEAEQRAVVRFVIQDGYGADVIFAAGTTGEWDRVSNAVRQRVVQVCSEEAAKVSAGLRAPGGRGVEVWAGITAPSRAETLENLDFALSTSGVDAAVLAPLSIPGLGDPVRFVARDVADLLDSRARRIPLYLYDNADIAVDPAVPHMRTKQVKALSRLDFVRGVKVSAPKKVLGNYIKAAGHFRERGEFGIYAGDAMLIFELLRPPVGLSGFVRDHWNRWRMRGGQPTGVVAGPANVLPREWARAWHVCRAGDAERMDEVQEVVQAFRVGTRMAGGRRSIACLKRALVRLGVTTSSIVAPGTPSLGRPDAERFDEAFEAVRRLAREKIAPPWRTLAPADEPPPRALA